MRLHDASVASIQGTVFAKVLKRDEIVAYEPQLEAEENGRRKSKRTVWFGCVSLGWLAE
jgi:hypothetical protein